jgi:hypothetical protein
MFKCMSSEWHSKKKKPIHYSENWKVQIKRWKYLFCSYCMTRASEQPNVDERKFLFMDKFQLIDREEYYHL